MSTDLHWRAVMETDMTRLVVELADEAFFAVPRQARCTIEIADRAASYQEADAALAAAGWRHSAEPGRVAGWSATSDATGFETNRWLEVPVAETAPPRYTVRQSGPDDEVPVPLFATSVERAAEYVARAHAIGRRGIILTDTQTGRTRFPAYRIRNNEPVAAPALSPAEMRVMRRAIEVREYQPDRDELAVANALAAIHFLAADPVFPAVTVATIDGTMAYQAQREAAG